MQPADLQPGQLVGLGGPHGGLHDAVQNVPVELCRPGLALGSTWSAMNRSASSATVGVPRSVVFWFAGSCPCATAPRMTLARALARSGVILPTAAMV